MLFSLQLLLIHWSHPLHSAAAQPPGLVHQLRKKPFLFCVSSGVARKIIKGANKVGKRRSLNDTLKKLRYPGSEYGISSPANYGVWGSVWASLLGSRNGPDWKWFRSLYLGFKEHEKHFKPISQLRFVYDTTTIRRYHDAFEHDGSDRNYDLCSIRLRYDFDTITTENWHVNFLLASNRVEWKQARAIRRSRIVVVSQSNRNCNHGIRRYIILVARPSVYLPFKTNLYLHDLESGL